MTHPSTAHSLHSRHQSSHSWHSSLHLSSLGAHEVRVHYQNCSEVFPFLFHFPHGKNGRNEKKYEESGFPIGPRFTCTYVLPYVFRVTFYVKPFVLYLTLSILQEVNIDVTAIHLNFILTGHPVCFLEFFGNH